MENTVYFAVERWHDREQVRLFYDIVPRELMQRGSPLVYCTLLERMPGGTTGAIRLPELLAIYQSLKSRGELPPEERGQKPPPPKQETRISHEHWTPPPATWDRDAPAYPPLAQLSIGIAPKSGCRA